MLTLYHGSTSVCSIKARLAFAEKGVAFESKLMTLRGDQFDPAYMKLNPNAVVPTIVHDGKVIIESTVIHALRRRDVSGAILNAGRSARAYQVRMTEKLMDEYVHTSCMTITFSTANRAHLMKLSPHELEEELQKSPDQSRAEIKRQVVAHGLDAPLVKKALRVQETLLDRIEAATAGSVHRRRDLFARRRCCDALRLAPRQVEARQALGQTARRRRLVRARPRASLVQSRGRRLGLAPTSIAMRRSPIRGRR